MSRRIEQYKRFCIELAEYEEYLRCTYGDPSNYGRAAIALAEEKANLINEAWQKMTAAEQEQVIAYPYHTLEE